MKQVKKFFWPVILLAGIYFMGGKFILAADPVTVNILEQDNLHTRIEIRITDFTKTNVSVDGESCQVISVEGMAPADEKGAPDLPQIYRLIQIPNQTITSYNIVDKHEQSYQNMEIAPSKGRLTYNDNPENFPRIKGTAYSVNTAYPNELFELETPVIIRDVRAVKFGFNPFQYNPVTKEMTFTDRLVVDILYESVSANASDYSKLADKYNFKIKERPASPEFKSIYPKLMQNYNLEYATKAGAATTSATTYDLNGDQMLIITTSEFASDAVLAKYIAWKEQRGIQVELDSTSASGGSSAIQAKIASKYNDTGLTYVILIGDIDDVPSLMKTAETNSASDPSYVLLEGNDNYGDALISRFSVSNVTELENQLNKVLTHEQGLFTTTDWINKAAVMACTNEPNKTSHANKIVNAMLSHSTNFTSATKILESSSDSSNNTAAIKNAFESGTNIITYVGHGANTYWYSIPFTAADAGNLKSSNGCYPMIHNVSCETGNFAYSKGDCFAEALMKAVNSGPVVGCFATDDMYAGPGDTAQLKAFTDYYYSDGEETFGALFYYAEKYAMGVYSKQMANILYRQWHIFGDCSTLIRKTVSQTSITTTATPTPSPTKTPVASPSPTKTPVASPSPTKTPVASPSPTKTPVASPSPTKTPVASPSPTKTPAASPSPTKTPRLSPSPTKTPTPSSSSRRRSRSNQGWWWWWH